MFRLTLNWVFWATIFGLSGVLGGAYYVIGKKSEEAVVAEANARLSSAVAMATSKTEGFLIQGQTVVQRLAKQLQTGGCAEPESCLMAELARNPAFVEVTLTQGKDLGTFYEDDYVVLAPEGRRQTTVFRLAGDSSEVCTRSVSEQRGVYVARTRCRPAHQFMTTTGTETTGETVDPTFAYGFKTPAANNGRDRVLMTDLSYSQLDVTLPEAQRRVVLNALIGVEDANQKLLGVFKVSMLEKEVRDTVNTLRVNHDIGREDRFKIFLADGNGHPISSPDGDNTLVDSPDEELRAMHAVISPAMLKAIEQPEFQAVAPEKRDASTTFLLDGGKYSASYRLIERSRGWRLVVVGPNSYYLDQLREQQQPLLAGMTAAFILLFIGGVFSAQVVRKALSQIQHETKGMSGFSFAATKVHSPFADVRETLFSLEQAKTAVRAMGRYVPLALVQKLFQDNAEPALGGTLREVTVFFSDIEGFTTRTEEEPPDVVARWLGQYLEVMTTAVHKDDGTVDKFIGDSVMALWNAPRPNVDHAMLACQAALRCQRETAKLYASEHWGGRAPLVTRIGLHVGPVMVGHFGAPDRISYTAIGDTVNLASRLEGLNKMYGTTILVSGDVHQRARHKFAFRRLDIVAVKGKSHAINVYELLGELELPGLITEEIQRYEQALELYVQGEFAKARALLLQNPTDPPSKVLAARCGELERTPPAEPWAGISFAQSK